MLRSIIHCLLAFALYSISRAQLILVEDTSNTLRYSNSGPSWHAWEIRTGGGDRVAQVANANGAFHGYNWHEAYGDGASISFTFTGTRVVLTGASAMAFYNTRIRAYVDDELKSTYTNVVSTVEDAVLPSPEGRSVDNYHFGTTMFDISGLSPGQHTFRAVSFGANSLFIVDTVQYEPSGIASPASSAFSSSTSVGQSNSPVTSKSTNAQFHLTTMPLSTLSPSSSSSSPLPLSSPSPQSSLSTEAVTSLMDIRPSDPRIVYSPPGAWNLSTDKKRTESCLSGTIASAMPGSSLSLNFTGTALQLYTLSSDVQGRYNVTLDGQHMGSFDTYTSHAELSQCSLSAQFIVQGLNSSQHSLVMTVEAPSDGSNRTAIQFVGFRLSSAPLPHSIGASQQTSKPPTATIVGGVIGAIAILAIVLCAYYFIPKREDNVYDDEEGDDGVTTNNFETTTAILPFTSNGKRRFNVVPPSTPALSSGTDGWAHWYTISSGPSQMSQDRVTSATPMDQSEIPPVTELLGLATPSEPQVECSTSPHPLTAVYTPNDTGTGSDVDRLTLYTLPPYDEQVGGRRRELSEADMHAIERRLGEVLGQGRLR